MSIAAALGPCLPMPMGIIVNPRGTNGAGKTELVRRLVAGLPLTPILRPGRPLPIAYRVEGPFPFIILGHYERTSGGCDTIPLRDGGPDEVFRLADQYAEDIPVLLEGALLSREVTRTAALAAHHEVHVICLATPLDACVRNLLARRRAGPGARDTTLARVATLHAAIDAAAARLAPVATVAHLPFDLALARARELLATDRTGRHAGLCPAPRQGQDPWTAKCL